MANHGTRILFLGRRRYHRLSRQLGRFPSISAFRFSHELTHDVQLQRLQFLPGCNFLTRPVVLLRPLALPPLPKQDGVPVFGTDAGQIWTLSPVWPLLLLGASRSGGIVEGCQGWPQTRRRPRWRRPTAAWLAVINPPAYLSRYKRPSSA